MFVYIHVRIQYLMLMIVYRNMHTDINYWRTTAITIINYFRVLCTTNVYQYMYMACHTITILYTCW